MTKNRINELLREFQRICGTGNLRASSDLLPEIILHLVQMIEDVRDGKVQREEIKGAIKEFYEAPAPVVPVTVSADLIDSAKGLGIDVQAEVAAALAAEGAKADISVEKPAKKAKAKASKPAAPAGEKPKRRKTVVKN